MKRRRWASVSAVRRKYSVCLAHSSGGQIIRRFSAPVRDHAAFGKEAAHLSGYRNAALFVNMVAVGSAERGDMQRRPAFARASPSSRQGPHYSPFFSTGAPNPNRCVVRRQRKQMYVVELAAAAFMRRIGAFRGAVRRDRHRLGAARVPRPAGTGLPHQSPRAASTVRRSRASSARAGRQR